MSSANSNKRVAIIGFDSLDPGLLSEWASAGQLPTFQRLFRESAWLNVTNPRGFEAGTCWPSMWTGTLPDHHGIHDAFYVFDSKQYCVRIAQPNEIPPEPFWIDASRDGQRMLLVDVPYSFVAPGLDGMQVCDWLVHVRSDDQRIHCYPPELAERIGRDYGLNPWHPPNRCAVNEQDAYSVDGLRDMVKTLSDRVAMKTRFCRDMLRDMSWNFFFTVFHEAHDVGHMCWHGHDATHERYDPVLRKAVGDPLLQVYQRLDSATGELLDSLPADATVLVYTSHGIGPERTASRFLDSILARLELGKSAEEQPLSILDRLAPLYRRLVPAALRRYIAPSSVGLRAYRWAASDRLRHRRYFALNPSYATGGIRFNVKGRDEHGLVEPGAELEALMHEVADCFREMRNADTGEPLVVDITYTSDLYDGPKRAALPDMLLEWNKSHPIERVTSPRIGEVRNPVQSVRSGDHAMSKQGLLFVPRGTHECGRQPDAAVIDLAPTILSLLGVSAQHLSGKPLPLLATGIAERYRNSA